MKILLADDHTLFRESLSTYVSRNEPDYAVTEARDIHETVSFLKSDQTFDVVLLDFRMPGMNGLQGLDKIRDLNPDLSVVLMSGLAESADVKDAMKRGAAGYIPKTLSARVFISALQDIVSGKTYVARDHNTGNLMPAYYHGQQTGQVIDKKAAGLSRVSQGQPGKLLATLTDREQEVLNHLIEAKANKEIARDLDIEVVTVKLHVRNLMKKLGARNRTEAALIARDLGVNGERHG